MSISPHCTPFITKRRPWAVLFVLGGVDDHGNMAFRQLSARNAVEAANAGHEQRRILFRAHGVRPPSGMSLNFRKMRSYRILKHLSENRKVNVPHGLRQ